MRYIYKSDIINISKKKGGHQAETVENMNFTEMKQEAIKEQLPDLDLETKLTIYNELELTDDEFYYSDLDELIETYFDGAPVDAVKAAYFGDFSLNDDYFTIDVYGHIKGYTDYSLNNTLDMVLNDHLEEINSLDDNILNYFDFDEINDIEEETEEISARAADYWELRKDRQKLFDDFSNKFMFYAFSQDQLEQGLKKLNCKSSDICHLYSGAYILKNKIDDYKKLFIELDIHSILENDPDLMQAAIYEELNNHEYILLFDPQSTIEEVYNELGLSPDNKTAAAAMKKATNLIEKQAYYYDF